MSSERRTPLAIPQPTGRLDAAARAQLDPAQLDAVAATMLNLVAEVAALAERLRALEMGGASDSTSDATAVDDLVRRVVAPLTNQ